MKLFSRTENGGVSFCLVVAGWPMFVDESARLLSRARTEFYNLFPAVGEVTSVENWEDASGGSLAFCERPSLDLLPGLLLV